MRLSALSPFLTQALLLALVGLTSCSQGIDSATHCSKIQSVYASPQSGAAKSPFLAFGGFLDVLQRPDALADISSDKTNFGIRRCTFTFDFEKNAKGEIKTFIWTGQHCLAAHLAEDVTLKLFDAEKKEYVNFSATIEPVERAKKLRKEIKSLPENLQRDLISSFSIGGTEATAKAVNYCKQISNVTSASGDQNVCASAYDLGRFEIKFIGEHSDNQKTLIKKGSDNYFQKYDELFKALQASSVGLEEKIQIFSWMSTMKTVSTMREGVGISQLVTRVLKCTDKSQEEICAHKSSVQTLFPEAFTEATGFSFVYPGKTYEQAFREKLVATEASIAKGLKSIIRIGTPALNFTLNTNLASSKMNSSEALKNTVGTDPLTAYIALPLHKLSSTSDISEDSYQMKEMGIVYSVKKDFSTVYFQPGDSGSTLSFRGLFPVAAVSTVNGNPTSGGAVLKPLPKKEEMKPSSSDASPNNNSAERDPNSQVTQKGKGPC